MFKYDPATLRENLAENGYAHLKDVLSDDFKAYLKDFYESAMRDAANESEDWKIKGKKRQFLFEFPSNQDAIEFRDGLARLTEVAENAFTVSERHLKVYDENAEPYPAPHKDRAASLYSIGIPVYVSEGSTVCIFPDLDPGPNKEDNAVFMTERDRPDLKDIYQNEHAVLLNDKVGDIVIFLGSALWHERVRASGTAVLYLKVNDAGIDPLGENIYANPQEKQ